MTECRWEGVKIARATDKRQRRNEEQVRCFRMCEEIGTSWPIKEFSGK